MKSTRHDLLYPIAKQPLWGRGKTFDRPTTIEENGYVPGANPDSEEHNYIFQGNSDWNTYNEQNTRQIQPDVIVGDLAEARVTNDETNFVAACLAGYNVLFVSGVVFTTDRTLVNQVLIGMDSPDAEIDIDTFDLTLNECSGYIGITTNGGKLILNGVTHGLNIRGSVTVEEGLNFSGSYYLNGVWPVNIGDIISPLCEIDFQNAINFNQGVGVAAFNRSKVKTFVDRYGVVREAAIDTPAFEKEGMSIEGPGTTLLTYAIDYTNAAWGKTNVTPTAGQADPKGGTNATILDATVTGGSIIQTVTTSVDTEIRTFSIDLKAGTAANTSLRLQYGVFLTNNEITWTAGVPSITAGSATIGEKLKNDFYRISIQGPNDNNATGTVWIKPAGTLGGIGTVIAYVSQFETWPHATSRIISVASPLTRTADLLSITYDGNAPAPEDDMTIIMDISYKGWISGVNQYLFNIEGEASRSLIIGGSGVLFALHGTTNLVSSILTANIKYRVAYVNDGTNLSIYINGELVNSINQEVVGGAASGNMIIGASDVAGNNPFYGNIDILKVDNRPSPASEVRIS
ncbi:hypothetical protein KAR91_87275 [Candidatus Pacearchaeota archaeon]|nr:hypothetical protein [Candidatus Pacearchaeota archaeon]